MKHRYFALLLVLFIAVTAMLQETNAFADETEYTRTVFPLERNGKALYLSQTLLSGTQPQKQIQLVHGVTYSSHEFNIDYQDYSLVRLLALRRQIESERRQKRSLRGCFQSSD